MFYNSSFKIQSIFSDIGRRTIITFQFINNSQKGLFLNILPTTQDRVVFMSCCDRFHSCSAVTICIRLFKTQVHSSPYKDLEGSRPKQDQERCTLYGSEVVHVVIFAYFKLHICFMFLYIITQQHYVLSSKYIIISYILYVMWVYCNETLRLIDNRSLLKTCSTR